ncbi:xanthine dehydrogenase accessory protein XdhC [Massilia sp. ST3]|uniref:xanthine dehydrogenase accessory protein XdhC n=1 Tax=Massilia sp. ST3 TaxID=2824903 RepID=UPI001B824D2F|nr:xanthine dehydrogenase accessory protein XdhC [Massilia sp. ST3]MBQ5946552.1 xanthine dehydrogenase accessory protein XdhC [Massilia sp. ST3]
MEDWLTAAPGVPAVLVTVARVEGSVPREAGARMLVQTDGFLGTIGGGHLEHRALEIARAMLRDGSKACLERFPLGPSLGQCCGGIAYLAFEKLDADQLALLAARRNEHSWRLVALDGEAQWSVFDGQGRLLAGEAGPSFAFDAGTHVMAEEGGRRWLADAVRAPRAHLMLFGAGHVGAALVRALAELPCRVTWIDEREEAFPANVPANVTVEATDTPEVLVEKAPRGTTFLVMTHSHALDLRLSHAILSRPWGDWYGLIGSETKRRQFEHRLRERGIPEPRLESMVCPIGLSGIAGKAPAVIAASVAAQLLSLWEAAAHPEPSSEPN